MKIKHESITLEHKPKATPDTDGSPVEPSTTTIRENNSLENPQYWGVGKFRFRFSLKNFRPGRDFFQRRFSISEASLLLLAAYLASRGLGVVRQVIFNTIFGTSPEANAYYAAFHLPDTLFYLIAGGALVQAFVPVLVSYEQEHGQRETWRLASLVFNVLLVTLIALVLLGEFLAPTFVSTLLVPGFSPAEQALTTSLTRIMLIQPLILGLGTIATALLNSKRQFFLPAFSIAIHNLGLIAGLLITLALPRVGIYGPTFGVLIAAACQVVVLIPGLAKQGVHYTNTWDLKNPGLRDTLRLLGPNTLSVMIASIASIVETAFISFLPDNASLAAQHNADMLFALPTALLAATVAQAALPSMSFLAARRQYTHLSALTWKLVGGIMLLGVPTAILLCVFGKPIIHLLFQHGAFTKHSSSLTFLALIGYAVGVPGSIVATLVARSFYALKDAKTPLLTNVASFVIRICLLLFLFKVIIGTYRILAIPLTASISLTAEAALLTLIFNTRLHAKRKIEAISFADEISPIKPVVVNKE